MNSTGDQMNTTYSISTADIPQTSTLRLHTKMEQPSVSDQIKTSSDQMNTVRLQPHPPPAEKIISTKLAVGEARTAFNEDQVSKAVK